jgi:hypothetical protein
MDCGPMACGLFMCAVDKKCKYVFEPYVQQERSKNVKSSQIRDHRNPPQFLPNFAVLHTHTQHMCSVPIFPLMMCPIPIHRIITA